jgi:hypothetical protein
MPFDPYGGYQAPAPISIPAPGIGSAGGTPAQSRGIAPSQTSGGASKKGTSVSGITPAAAPSPAASPSGSAPSSAAPASIFGAGDTFGKVGNASKNQYLSSLQSALQSGGLSVGQGQYQNQGFSWSNPNGSYSPGQALMANGQQFQTGANTPMKRNADGTYTAYFSDPQSGGTFSAIVSVDANGKVTQVSPGDYTAGQSNGARFGEALGGALAAIGPVAGAALGGAELTAALASGGGAAAGGALTASDLATSELASSQLAGSGLTAAEVAGASGAGVDAVLSGSGAGGVLSPASASIPLNEGGYNPALQAGGQGATTTDVTAGTTGAIPGSPASAPSSVFGQPVAAPSSALTPAAAPGAGVGGDAAAGLPGLDQLGSLPQLPVPPTFPQMAAGVDVGTAAAGGGVLDTLTNSAKSLGGKVLDYAQNNPAQAASIAATGYNAITQQQMQKNATSLGQEIQKLGIPLTQQSNQLLQQYAAGKLNPGDQMAIDQFIRQTTAQAKQYYANAGLGDSSMAQEAIQQIQMQGEQMRQSALQGYLQNATNLATAGNAQQTTGINAQISADQNLQDSQANILQALAAMAASQNKGVPGAPSTSSTPQTSSNTASGAGN